MRLRLQVKKRLAGLFWGVLSVPLFFKILGIGLLVGAVFGIITGWLVHGSVKRTLHETLQERVRSLAYSLVDSIERPMSTGDAFSVDEKLQRTCQMFPDVRYILVRDAKGRIVSHTFKKGVPADLARQRFLVRIGPELPKTGQRRENQERFRVLLIEEEGSVFEVTCPILEGRAGTLQLGVTDRMITQQLAAVTESVLWSLVLCATIGAGLALLLTYLLTHPIHHLVHAAKRVRGGDFRARSEIFSADEIGRLAVAFNQMTESLQRYHREVRDKERVRVLLIERIVHTQEEERKNISRELHDHFGQSLLALLLMVQSLCKESGTPGGCCHDVESRIRQLIEDVRRLAWGMHPSILDDYGLDSALARYVAEISEHFNLPIDYQYSRSPGSSSPTEGSSPAAMQRRLPDKIEVALYRIAQEAITNIVRHARATRASTVVLQGGDEVTLLVEDDGRGFDGEAVPRDGAGNGGGLGLTGMKERAALLGGICVVESAPQQGTTIRVKIPLQKDQQCPSAS